ncbi:unnamed protein product, partial [Owenia fusiformis]
ISKMQKDNVELQQQVQRLLQAGLRLHDDEGKATYDGPLLVEERQRECSGEDSKEYVGPQIDEASATSDGPPLIQKVMRKCSGKDCKELCNLSRKQRMNIVLMEGVTSIELVTKTKRYLITTYNDPVKVKTIKEKIGLDEELSKHAFDFESLESEEDIEGFFASGDLLDEGIRRTPGFGTMGAYVKRVDKSNGDETWYVATCSHVFPMCSLKSPVYAIDNDRYGKIGELAYTIDPFTKIDGVDRETTFDLALVKLNPDITADQIPKIKKKGAVV